MNVKGNLRRKSFCWGEIKKKEAKRSFSISCIVFVYMMITIAFGTERWEVQYCYEEIYNIADFISVYLVLFLIGLIPIVNKIFVPELAIRYTNKFDYVHYFSKKMTTYSFLYSCMFLFTNIIVFLVLCTDGEYKSSSTYIFFLLAWINQWIGWVFIGCLFMISYILFQHIVISFLVTLMILTSTIGMEYILDGIYPYECYFKVYKMMYYFYEQKNIFHIMKFMSYYICLIVIMQIIMYWILKKKDFIQKKRR